MLSFTNDQMHELKIDNIFFKKFFQQNKNEQRNISEKEVCTENLSGKLKLKKSPLGRRVYGKGNYR